MTTLPFSENAAVGAKYSTKSIRSRMSVAPTAAFSENGSVVMKKLPSSFTLWAPPTRHPSHLSWIALSLEYYSCTHCFMNHVL